VYRFYLDCKDKVSIRTDKYQNYFVNL